VSDHGVTVFVVDDDASVRRGLERLLRSVGYRVETFASAREFLERGRLEGAGCLVLDVRMPGQSGLELHEVLVAGGHDIPVVFITGHGDIPMAVRAMKSGAADFLAKPFDDEVLLDAVRQAIATDRSRRPEVGSQ
jgi:two-component system, LuxR family, response regulator FixJ